MDTLFSPTRHRLAVHGAPNLDHHGVAIGGGGRWDDRGRGGRSAGLGLLDGRTANGSSWLARFVPSPGEDKFWRSTSTSTSSSFTLSSLWQNFRLFEGPRRRTLTSPSSNAPTSMLTFCWLCSLWYMSSAMSSNSGKAILNQFRYPITLTYVQFAFVAMFCLLFSSPAIRFTRLRRPTKAILEKTLPMGLFQVGGHMFSSMAISRIPVSTVHTIKALSPLFTVAAYALLFGVKYSPKTYISLLPLTVGVMLACSFDMSASNALGLLCAFGSAVVFVSSNIFFKKIMPSNAKGVPQNSAQKLDKLNLLFYSSSMAFLVMTPIWMFSDLPALMSASNHVSHPTKGHSSPHSVLYYFLLNGTVNFGQNIIAFVILASTSPVTYSIASLFKRVAVICIAIVWFNQSVHPIQGAGICMTFLGLWMYNNAKADVEKGEKKMRRVEAARDLVLPSTREELRAMHGSEFNSPALSENEDNAEPESSKSSAFERANYTSPTNTLGNPFVPQHKRENSLPSPRIPQHHFNHPNNPNLHITTAPLSKQSIDVVKRAAQSPTDSYPSPPLSHDSPPISPPPITSLDGTAPAPPTSYPRPGRRATFSHGGGSLRHNRYPVPPVPVMA